LVGRAAECRDIAVRLASIKGTSVHGVGPDGNVAVFSNPVFSGFDMVCYRADIIGVLVRSARPIPSREWYSLAAIAGTAVTGVNSSDLEAAIRKCHVEARSGGSPVFRIAERKDFDICPICLREELLFAAASLHLHTLKHNAKETGEPVSADQIYKFFTEAAYREMYKLVDLEIEHGGMTGLYKQ